MSRHEANLRVLKKLKSNQPLTHEDIQQYSGWGGLHDYIYDKTTYRDLKKLMSDEEIRSIKQTLTNGYYTPQPIVDAIWQGLDKLGCRFGCVLEPSAGVGAFLEGAKARNAEKILSVEIDDVSCQLLKSRFADDITIIHSGFEAVSKAMIPPCDIILGNPPYGRQVIQDANIAILNNLVIHHYFFAKGIMMLAEGGVLAMVLPAYCLDNYKGHAREIIAKQGGRCIAAFRLPDDCFSHAKVTVDVVFFVKDTQNAYPHLPKWQESVYSRIDGHRLAMNEYYLNHPEHVLGKLAAVDIYDRKGLSCVTDREHYAELARLVQTLPLLRKNAFSLEYMKLEVLDKRLGAINQKISMLNQSRSALLDLKSKMVDLQKQFQDVLKHH